MGTSNILENKRVFICTDTDYPNLDAASNYVANMAKTLGLAGLEVYLISLDRACEKGVSKSNDWIKADLFSYATIPYCVANKVEILKSRVLCGKKIISYLERMTCSNDDVIITYLYKAKTNKDVVSWAKKNKIKIYATVVEWFEGASREQEKCFAQYERCNGVIAISKNIEEYFRGLGLRTMILPPIVDMGRFEDLFQKSIKEHQATDKVNFLYTGNFVGKDDMRVMLEALAILSDEVRSIIEFHITRFAPESLKNASGVSDEIWDRVKDGIVTHGDVTVDELRRLLECADYLPIARQANRTTVSNFPSKIPEAMAAGVVPIMTRVGDCPNDYLTDGTDSILFEDCTPECCANAFVRAVNMSESGSLIDMKNGAYTTAKKRFGIENYVDRLSLFVNES